MWNAFHPAAKRHPVQQEFNSSKRAGPKKVNNQ
jgi:hypothetical protein